MTKKINKLKETYNPPPTFAGNPSFQGGPYGFGGDKQLAKKNAKVAEIEDQEQAEHNDNVESRRHIGVSMNERTASDAFAPAPHLPGNRYAGSIENPQVHTPKDDPEEMDAGRPVDYVDPFEIQDLVKELVINELGMEDVFAYQDAPELPVGGMGVVIQPKSHVPDEHTQSSKFEDDDLDGIPNHVDLNLPSPLRMYTDMDEKLDPNKDDAGDYIEDFQKSDAAQFKGKSKEKRKEMALAAYYDDKKQNEKTKLEEKILRKTMEKIYGR